MNPADRRQDLRREEDEEIRVILARYGVRLDQQENLLDKVGNSMGHLAVLDSRVEDTRAQLDKFESEIRLELHEIRTDVGAMKVALESLRTKVGIWSTVGAVLGAGIVTALTQLLPHS